MFEQGTDVEVAAPLSTNGAAKAAQRTSISVQNTSKETGLGTSSPS
jgi:hypothetical protein